MAEIAKPDMSEVEARECVAAIKGGMEIMVREAISVNRSLAEFHDRNGWKALGYGTWDDCIAAEFGQSRRTIFRQLKAGRLEMELTEQETLGEIPEALPYLKPLSALPEAERKAAYDEAVALAKGRPLTAKHVEHVVQRRVDAAFLEPMEIRACLSDHCRKVFDRDALFWRNSRPDFLEFEKAARAELAKHRAEGGRPRKGSHAAELEFFLGAMNVHPKDQVVCPDCKGQGQVKLIGECPLCHGEGTRTWANREPSPV